MCQHLLRTLCLMQAQLGADHEVLQACRCVWQNGIDVAVLGAARGVSRIGVPQLCQD